MNNKGIAIIEVLFLVSWGFLVGYFSQEKIKEKKECRQKVERSLKQ